MLLRIDILDATFGVCLFEKVWKWSGVSRAEGLCKLVLTFHQISREIGDTGEVSQVLFDLPATQTIIRDRGHSTAGPHFNTGTAQKYQNIYVGSMKNKIAKEKPNTIRLSCGKNEPIIVAVFHEQTDRMEHVQKFINSVVTCFHDDYAKKMSSMKKKLEEVSNSDNQNVLSEMMESFRDFSSKLSAFEKAFNSNNINISSSNPTPGLESSQSDQVIQSGQSDSITHRSNDRSNSNELLMKK